MSAIVRTMVFASVDVVAPLRPLDTGNSSKAEKQ
jgi:hypothetical protein